MKTAKQLMGDSKGKSQQKEQECFLRWLSLYKNKIAYSQNLKSLAIMQKKVMQNLKFVLSN